MRAASSGSGAANQSGQSRHRQQSPAYTPSPSSTASAQGLGHHHHEHAPVTAVTQGEVSRSLVFGGSVPLCVSLPSEELPAGSDRSVEVYYVQAPRIGYLPLLIPEIRKNLLDLVLDDNERAILNEEQLWFECDGEPLKWHWPIGLIHDVLRANRVQRVANSHRSSSPLPSRNRPAPSDPLNITLHLANPPNEKLLSPSLDTCRVNFMNQLKEADYVRWGSVRRMTSLRRADQDALWESVVNHDYDKFWSVANKLVPAPPVPSAPSSASPSRATSPVLHTTSTFDATGRVPDAKTQRSIPMRIYLPHGGPVIQDVVPATIPSTGRPQTLQSALETLLPALFPPRPGPNVDMTASFISHAKQLISRVVVQGIEMPLDAELAWCSSCLAYPDGWLGIVLGL